MTWREPPASEPGLDEEMARRLLDGWHPRDIVRVYNDRIHIRTAYRWRTSLVGLEVVRLGDHEATFAIRNDGPPVRLTPWDVCGQTSGITALQNEEATPTMLLSVDA